MLSGGYFHKTDHSACTDREKADFLPSAAVFPEKSLYADAGFLFIHCLCNLLNDSDGVRKEVHAGFGDILDLVKDIETIDVSYANKS